MIVILRHKVHSGDDFDVNTFVKFLPPVLLLLLKMFCEIFLRQDKMLYFSRHLGWLSEINRRVA